MTKSDMSDLFFTILISAYLTGQLARLKEYFLEEISSKITSVQNRERLRQEHLFVALFVALPNSFSSPKLGNKLSD